MRNRNRLAVVMILAWLMATPLPAQAPADEEDPLRLSPEMMEFLEKHISRNSDSDSRLRELVDVVFNKNILGFKYEAATHTAVETFEGRRGNCLSFTSMLVAMARHIGLKAKFREVDTVPVWGQRGGVFTVSQHVNVAVDMGSRSYVVDLYPEIGALEIGGAVVSDQRGLAHFYNNQAVERLGAGDSEGALRYLNRALELAPEAPFLWTNLGVIRGLQRDPKGAEEAYLKALALRPNHLPAVSNLADAYTKMGLFKKAEHFRNKARRFRDRNPYYHYRLGLDAWALGDLPEALKRYKKAVKLKREEHRFHFALAQVFNRLGKTDRALRHLELASLYAPDESGRLRYHQKQRLLMAHR